MQSIVHIVIADTEQLADGYFSALHRRMAGKTGEQSSLETSFFKEADMTLHARMEAGDKCNTSIVAASNLVCKEKRNDIQGI